MNVIDILESLESVPSRGAKEEILSDNRRNELLISIFKAVESDIDYGVKKFTKQAPRTKECEENDHIVNSFLNGILPLLAQRLITGNQARELIEASFMTMSALQQKWCERILLRNLRCGVSIAVVKKVWPDLIQKFAVQLAHSVDAKVTKSGLITTNINYPVMVEPKLDGFRVIAVKDGKDVKLYTRNGTVLETIPKIQNAIANLSVDQVVLDGEACGKDWNESAAILSSRKNLKNDDAIVYNIFDCLSHSEWSTKKTISSYAERRKMLQTCLEGSGDPLRVVPFGIVQNDEELYQNYLQSLGLGYEGVMVKDFASPYAFSRTQAVLKLKPVATYEGVIVDCYNGHAGTKNEHIFGGFSIVLSNGVVTNVGSGFTQVQRSEFQMTQKADWIGKIIECEGQPPLTVDGRIRFPVFVRFRDENDVDPDLIKVAKRYLNQH